MIRNRKDDNGGERVTDPLGLRQRGQ